MRGDPDGQEVGRMGNAATTMQPPGVVAGGVSRGAGTDEVTRAARYLCAQCPRPGGVCILLFRERSLRLLINAYGRGLGAGRRESYGPDMNAGGKDNPLSFPPTQNRVEMIETLSRFNFPTRFCYPHSIGLQFVV